MGISLLLEMLASKRFKEIGRLKETKVEVPIQLEKKKERKKWSMEGENSKYSKKRAFSSKVHGWRELGSKVVQACGLWPVAFPILLALLIVQFQWYDQLRQAIELLLPKINPKLSLKISIPTILYFCIAAKFLGLLQNICKKGKIRYKTDKYPSSCLLRHN